MGRTLQDAQPLWALETIDKIGCTLGSRSGSPLWSGQGISIPPLTAMIWPVM
jgi:hypothetical protein